MLLDMPLRKWLETQVFEAGKDDVQTWLMVLPNVVKPHTTPERTFNVDAKASELLLPPNGYYERFGADETARCSKGLSWRHVKSYVARLMFNLGPSGPSACRFYAKKTQAERLAIESNSDSAAVEYQYIKEVGSRNRLWSGICAFFGHDPIEDCCHSVTFSDAKGIDERRAYAWTRDDVKNWVFGMIRLPMHVREHNAEILGRRTGLELLDRREITHELVWHILKNPTAMASAIRGLRQICGLPSSFQDDDLSRGEFLQRVKEAETDEVFMSTAERDELALEFRALCVRPDIWEEKRSEKAAAHSKSVLSGPPLSSTFSDDVAQIRKLMQGAKASAS